MIKTEGHIQKDIIPVFLDKADFVERDLQMSADHTVHLRGLRPPDTCPARQQYPSYA